MVGKDSEQVFLNKETQLWLLERKLEVLWSSGLTEAIADVYKCVCFGSGQVHQRFYGQDDFM